MPQPAGVATSELVEETAGIEEDEEELDGLVDQENKWDQHAAEFCRKEKYALIVLVVVLSTVIQCP